MFLLHCCIFFKHTLIKYSNLHTAGSMTIISRLVQIHKMDIRSKLEEERERKQHVPTSPTILPASPVPDALDKVTSARFGEGDASGDGGDNGDSIVPGQRRRSSTNRLQRQEKSVREGKLLCTQEQSVPPILG